MITRQVFAAQLDLSHRVPPMGKPVWTRHDHMM